MNLRLVVEGEEHEVTLEPGEEGHYHVNVGAEPFDVEVDEHPDGGILCRLDGTEHRVERRGRTLYVDGERVDVGVRQLAQAGLGPGRAAGGEITPPMPGRIVEILVSEGDEVQEGQPLLTLEAMKMQNEIAAPGQGRVGRILVSEGDTVEASDVLVELEPA